MIHYERFGISATYINSSLSNSDYMQTIENAILGMYKIIYVAPERLNSESFLRLLNSIDISMIAIDEAHCVSQWGHDFRPSYTEIANVILNLKKRPIVTAFTATATEIVKRDIIDLLKLSNPFVLTTGFDRENLSFHVVSTDDRKRYIYSYLRQNSNTSGIIYCLTRKTVDSLYEDLCEIGYKVSKYHGGMSDKDRTKNQDDFVYDRTNVMIATNAFGMGIDKSNIRYVLHYNMPKDLESYYQEAGRAGRDGIYAECTLLFSRADIVTNKFIIEQGNPNINHKMEYQKLNDIIDYCNTDKCLRKYILEYFGETPTFSSCNNCSNCNTEVEITDITEDAKKIMSCIKRMNERFGVNLVTDVLKGSHSSKVINMGFDRLSTYGLLKDYSKDTIKELISFLVSEGYINSVGEQYPILVLNKNANDILFGNKTVQIRRKFKKLKHRDDVSDVLDDNLFDILKALRKELAEKAKVPPFVIFTDATLSSMCVNYPTSKEEMLAIPGVGEAKFNNYGKLFIEVIQEHLAKNTVDFTHVTKKATPKEDTKVTSYNLYKEGKSIDEISKIRNLTKQTIETHLLKCYEDDFEIDLEKDIHTDFKDVIYEAILANGTEKLKPLKDILPDKVSYMDIKYYIIKLKKED